MSRENNKVPRLRFPEFRDAGDWEEKRLGEVATFANHRVGISKILLEQFVSTESLLPDYGGIKIATKLPPDGTAILFKKGDILISNIRPYLKKVWFSNKSGGTSNDVIVVRARKTGFSRYLSFVLINDSFINYVMESAKGVKMPRGDINQIKEFPVAFPKDEQEQQKIADCLSSLDDLITAQTQKLAHLKTHKKGLMQQLFPAEGETVPKLRFPEFRDAGDWEEKPFGSVATFINGRAYKQEDLLDKGKYRVLRVGNFFSNKEWYFSNLELESNKYCDDGDLLYAWSASFGPRIWRGEQVIYHYHIWKVLENDGINRDFLFILLDYETEKMKSHSANGLGLLHITKGAIEGWKCYIPTLPEQQKIADCLSSLDDLITAQTQKLAKLKTHKKGLMQQLFPAADEVNG